MTCGLMTCEIHKLEIEGSLCSALMLSFVADRAQSTNQLTNSCQTPLRVRESESEREREKERKRLAVK